MDQTRNTKQRQIILSILNNSERPLSINEIYSRVIDELPKIAKSTIYRNIDALLSQNLIDKYHLTDNEVYYKIKADRDEHKHFVICDECQKVFDLPSCPIHEIESTLEEEGFIIKKHQIQITGICKDCMKKNLR